MIKHEIDSNGEERWFKDGCPHNDNGPAIISFDGKEVWFRSNSRLSNAWHRDNGPSEIRPDGEESWYKDDLNNRVNGPAQIRPDGSELWCRNGTFSRKDGPAQIWDSGEENFQYYEND